MVLSPRRLCPAGDLRVEGELSGGMTEALTLQATASSELSFLGSRSLGGAYVLDHLWRRLQIGEAIARAAVGRRLSAGPRAASRAASREEHFVKFSDRWEYYNALAPFTVRLDGANPFRIDFAQLDGGWWREFSSLSAFLMDLALIGHSPDPLPVRPCIGEAGALRSGRVVLSRPSSLLGPPPTPSRPPATSRALVIGGPASRAADPGPRRASPVPTAPFRPFHAPCAGGFVGTRSRFPGAVRGLRPPFIGSASPWPRSRGGFCDDAAGFASCCGLVGCSTPLRTRPLGHARGLPYRGPWRLPGPDSHRLAAVSLSLGYAS